MKRITVLLVAALLFVAAASAAPLFPQCPPVGVNTGCQFLITINPGSSVTVAADPNPPNNGPYETEEDTLVGVVNRSGVPVTSIPLSSPVHGNGGIFAMDSDGPCTPHNLLPATGCSSDPSGYGGPGVFFTNIAANHMSGTVTFNPPLPNGGSTWFGVEEALLPGQLVSGPPITATITPSSNFFPYPGSSVGSLGAASYGQVAVKAPSGAVWSAASNVVWLGILATNTGSGNGSIIFTVAANPGSAQRTGTLTIAGQTFTVTQAGPPPPTTIVPVIEYHNTATDDYFITAFPAEQTFVDSGVVGPWVRTGKNFNSGGPIPVYRFGGNPIINPATGVAYGPLTHFYTVWTDEQSWLQTFYNPNALSWTIEEPTEANGFGIPMYMQQPNPDRTCPAGTVQVFRASSSAGFHRFTPFASALQEVLNRGWTNEGVAFCAPQ